MKSPKKTSKSKVEKIEHKIEEKKKEILFPFDSPFTQKL